MDFRLFNEDDRVPVHDNAHEITRRRRRRLVAFLEDTGVEAERHRTTPMLSKNKSFDDDIIYVFLGTSNEQLANYEINCLLD